MIPESDVKAIPENADWPIFICYRQADGRSAAKLVYQALHDAVLTFTPGGYAGAPPVSIYFDQTAPAVADWTVVHGPALQRARAFVVVCTPGAFSRLGDDDWVYKELDWWLQNRMTAPVLVTTHGERWIPKELRDRWPNAQRLAIDLESLPPQNHSGYEEIRLQLRTRILEGIRETAVQVLYEAVERERARTKQLVWQRRFLLLLLIVASISALAAGVYYRAATKNQTAVLIESAQRMVSQASSLQRDHRPYSAGATLLHSLEILHSAPEDNRIDRLKAGIWQRFRALDIRSTALLEGHMGAVQSIDVSYDGRLAVSGSGYWGSGLAAVRSEDDSVRLWDLSNDHQIAVFSGHKAAVLRVRFDPQAAAIMSASQDGKIKVWDVPSRSLRCEIAVGEFTINLNTVDFTGDGKKLYAAPDPASNQKAGLLWWWSATDCSRVNALPSSVPTVTLMSWASSRMWTEHFPAAKVIAEWHPATAYSPIPEWFEVWAASLNPSGTLVAVGPGDDHGVLADCAVVLWDATSGQVVRRLNGHKTHVRAVAFSSDGQRLASGDETGLIIIWDVSTGLEIVRLEGHAGAIRSVKFASDDSVLSGSNDDTLRRWFLPRTPKETALSGRPYRMAVTADGRYRFESNGFGLEKRNSAADQAVARLSTGTDSIAVASTAPRIVTQTERRVYVRDADSLQPVAQLKGPFDDFESLAIVGNPAIVCSSHGGTIRVWDAVTGNRLNQIDRHASGEIAVTPDGHSLAGAFNTGEVRFWDPLTGRLQQTYLIDENRSKSPRGREGIDVSITPNGQIMFFTTFEGTVVAWDVENRRALASRKFALNKEGATTIDVLELRPAVTALSKGTAVVAVKSEIFLWDLVSNELVANWTSSRVVTQLMPGMHERSFFGVVDGLGLLSWQLPAADINDEIPNSKAAFDRYYDLVGMQIANAEPSGTIIVPRPIEPPEARLSAMLDDSNSNSQMFALSWLLRVHQPNPLLTAKAQERLQSSDSRVREAAVMAMSRDGALTSSKAALAIAPALLDSSAEVRVAALFSLENLGPASVEALPQLRQVLSKTDEYSERLGAHVSPRDIVCDILGNIGPPASPALPELVQIVQAPTPPHQMPAASCVRALGKIGNSEQSVIDALLLALSNPEINMRYQAAVALGHLPTSSEKVVNALDDAAKKDPDSVEIASALEDVRRRRGR